VGYLSSYPVLVHVCLLVDIYTLQSTCLVVHHFPPIRMSQTKTPGSNTSISQIGSPEGCIDRPVICQRHSDQNVTHIPQSFSEGLLWHCTDASLVVPSKQIFSDELIAEVLALVSYGFACADGTVPLGADSKEAPERSITLYCPDKGGNIVLDSMVKHVAAHHNADVLVLDALELAAGEFGALGKSRFHVIVFLQAH
jgi:hypothetical protein